MSFDGRLGVERGEGCSDEPILLFLLAGATEKSENPSSGLCCKRRERGPRP